LRLLVEPTMQEIRALKIFIAARNIFTFRMLDCYQFIPLRTSASSCTDLYDFSFRLLRDGKGINLHLVGRKRNA
jgi:hypothetical protein